ncbi:MAG: Zn-dependent alcohol dehydrogenase [Acidimicrobiales bacterium]|nr:Zn-dependent alcohol dehydrogenase [Acidimicrobiales bacterium]
MATAAVLTEVGSPLEVRDDVEVAPPGPGEVRVKTGASGVCHSDLSVQNGTIPLPTPIVLGHEGAGTVLEVGEGVTGVAPGDRVVLSFVPQCQECYFCKRGQGFLCEKSAMAAMGGMLDGSTRLTSQGGALHQMAMCGTYSSELIAPEISMVKIADDVPLKVAALIGCGVLTGVGAALNTADIHEGDTVAVIGCGGVGLNVIQGAKLAGAANIVAIDMFDHKLELATQFGATHCVKAGEQDATGVITGATGGRLADSVFEVIGLEQTMNQAIDLCRQGGEVVLVGVPRMDVMMHLPAAFTFLYLNKSIKGCWYGSANVNTDVPKLLGLYSDGKLMLDELISAEIDQDGINGAFEAMGTGEVARSVVVYE